MRHHTDPLPVCPRWWAHSNPGRRLVVARPLQTPYGLLQAGALAYYQALDRGKAVIRASFATPGGRAWLQVTCGLHDVVLDARPYGDELP